MERTQPISLWEGASYVESDEFIVNTVSQLKTASCWVSEEKTQMLAGGSLVEGHVTKMLRTQ